MTEHRSDSFKSYYRPEVVPAKAKIWVFLRFIVELWDARIAKNSKNLTDFVNILHILSGSKSKKIILRS